MLADQRGVMYTGACTVLLYGHDIQYLDELHDLTTAAGKLGLKVTVSRLEPKPPDEFPDSASDFAGATMDDEADT